MRPLKYLAVLLVVAACGTSGEAADDPTTTSGETTTTEETTTTGFTTGISLPESFSRTTLEVIVDDAARRTGVPMSEIDVTSVEAMTFNDAALGCPVPGKMYAQVLTPGFIVLLEAGGAELDYRVVEDSGAFRICEE